jgi:hypothetical protein
MTARMEWPELRALIAARIPQPVIQRLTSVPPTELKHLRPQLKALRTELRVNGQVRVAAGGHVKVPTS